MWWIRDVTNKIKLLSWNILKCTIGIKLGAVLLGLIVTIEQIWKNVMGP